DKLVTGVQTCALPILARWWLRDEMLARVPHGLPDRRNAAYWSARPELPSVRGGCWVVFANENPRELALLREALVLPLCWVPGVRSEEHTSELQSLAYL